MKLFVSFELFASTTTESLTVLPYTTKCTRLIRLCQCGLRGVINYDLHVSLRDISTLSLPYRVIVLYCLKA